MEKRYRLKMMESERGWGQKHWSGQSFLTMEEAKKEKDRINAENTDPITPDYYIKCDGIEEVWYDGDGNYFKKL